MIHPLIQKQIPEIKNVLLSHHVKSAYFFGSACTDNFNDKSDVDILLDFEEHLSPLEKGDNWWEIYYSLKKLLKREVDLVTSGNLVNPYFIAELNNSKQIIYG